MEYKNNIFIYIFRKLKFIDFKCIQTRPGLSLLAYCYYYTDDFQNASTIYEQLAALWPQETDYKLQHAQSLYSAGRYEDALRAANGITTSGYENKVWLMRVIMTLVFILCYGIRFEN